MPLNLICAFNHALGLHLCPHLFSLTIRRGYDYGGKNVKAKMSNEKIIE